MFAYCQTLAVLHTILCTDESGHTPVLGQIECNHLLLVKLVLLAGEVIV